MKKKIRELSLVFSSIIVFSFLFNFAWESFHGWVFYEGHNLVALEYVPMMAFVSMMDAFIILGMYLGVSMIWKDVMWIRTMNNKHVYVIILMGLILAFLIKYIFVFKLNWWNYNSKMPLILGIGLTPLLQLSVTGLLAMGITRKVF